MTNPLTELKALADRIDWKRIGQLAKRARRARKRLQRNVHARRSFKRRVLSFQ